MVRALHRSTPMHWRRRLTELGLAGGLLVPACDGTMGDTPSNTQVDAAFVFPRCNGNPDPCCVDETSATCMANRMKKQDPVDGQPRDAANEGDGGPDGATSLDAGSEADAQDATDEGASDALPDIRADVKDAQADGALDP